MRRIKGVLFQPQIDKGQTDSIGQIIFNIHNLSLVFSLPRWTNHSKISILGGAMPFHSLITEVKLCSLLMLELNTCNEKDLTENPLKSLCHTSKRSGHPFVGPKKPTLAHC